MLTSPFSAPSRCAAGNKTHLNKSKPRKPHRKDESMGHLLAKNISESRREPM